MRLLIVSNRLPVTIIKKGNKLRFQESVGGLVSGLSAYLNSLKSSLNNEYTWIGWSGISVGDDEKAKTELKEKLLSEFNAYPVFILEEDMKKFYEGFCNKTIWPLFHYFPSYAVYDEEYWNYYKKVNEIFSDTIMEIAREDDLIWIQDYHLMLLPKLIRKRMPNVAIGFFLHIPFPAFEVFRLFPSKWRTEILEGILGADLVGFHTHDYTQYFLRCVFRILGYEHTMGQVALNERIVKAETFPMGIDFQKFYNSVNNPEIQKEKEELIKTFANYKIILSVDRLDYTKGIVNRLLGYETFLEKNPEWHNKIILVLVVVPSRVGVEHYQKMKRQIDELIGKINGKFGSVSWTPILYQYRFLSFASLTSFYNISDIALITPLRDGMNLIAKEYLATRVDKTGVLILSEMAGASKELGEAIIINPNNTNEIADALKEALEMPKDEQIRRNQITQTRLKRYDAIRWGNDFIQTLLSVKDEQKRLNARFLSLYVKEKIIRDFKKAEKRLLLLDYDGTLVPFATHPKNAKPGEELLEILKQLSEDEKNEVVLISGRDKETLQNWFFSILNICLVAEHGIWIKEKGENWRITKPLTNEWKPQILQLLETYTDRLPGSFVEEKEFSVAWHYRKADPELSSIRAKELIDNLVNFTANKDVQILQGNKVVEVRSGGVNKGTIAMNFIQKNFDFILAIGDDATDEDLFKTLPEIAYSIKVGMPPTYAKFNTYNCTEVRELLNEISK